MRKEPIIVSKSESFALKIVECYKVMKSQNEFTLSKQLLRSGTSIGANVHEAQAAISKRDFISKMSIASKEARESKYWINLCIKSKIVDFDFSTLENDVDEIVRILTSIVKTSQLNT